MATSGAKSDYLEKAVLDYFLTNTAVTRPTSWTVGLFTSAPGEASTGGTEVSGGGYSRKAVTFTTSTVSGTTTAINAQIDFGQASANWGTVTHWVLFDQAGNRLYYGATENSGGTPTGFTVNNGDTFKFPAGAIVIEEQ